MMHILHRVGKGLEAGVAGESMLGGIGGFMLELEGKTALVFGVASEESIAWAICEQLAAAGCKLILGFQKRFMSRVFQLKEKLDAIEAFYPIDVSTNELTAEFFTEWQAENHGAKADIVIHAIGFAPQECFDRPILFVENEPINTAMTVSAHSLQRVMRHALPHLAPNSSTITLTYAASTRWVPHYGVMGVAKAALEAWTRELANHVGPDGHRINAISPGPIPTLAAGGIPGFDDILDHVERNAPLRRNVNQKDVAGCAVWLASPLSSGVTGQIIHVDAGYSSVMVPDSISD
ncbi:MAG TPA: SDR family oxidoreductase [Candidatus Thalassarchaeaceae archaeon]|jgi:enoyl-[acyl-carrier protein] reductase I|nr:SDR family oxidoreductase [Candidatus Thalassarchaeaceae archaeon]